MKFALYCSFPAWILSVLLPLCAVAGDNEDFLSEVYDQVIASEVQGWGKLGRDTAAVPPDGRPGSPIRLGEKVYEKGLGHHAPGELVFALPEGAYATFAAEVGIQWQGGGRGSVVFQVLVDGEKRFDSGVLSDSDAPRAVSVPVAGARELRLVATDGGDGIGCDMATWADARLLRDPNAVRIGEAILTLSGAPAPTPSEAVCGFSLIAVEAGPQVASLGRGAFVACVRDGEEVDASVPIANVRTSLAIRGEVALISGDGVEVALAIEGGPECVKTLSREPVSLEVTVTDDLPETVVHARTRGGVGESLVRWRNVQWVATDEVGDLRVLPKPPREEVYPPPVLPALRPSIEQALIEWDWRMQDGVGTEREPVSYAVAVERTLSRGDELLYDLLDSGAVSDDVSARWEALHDEWALLTDATLDGSDVPWEDLWRRTHELRRQIAFSNPLAQVGPVVFVKRVPAAFSHQLTQYYGRLARAGGGLFVLDEPGRSMACRALAPGELPPGSCMQPEVSYDASRILFAYCESPFTPTRENKESCLGRHYHLYEIRPDGSGLRQLTEGPYDDFSPRELPNGDLMFLSTRRGGFHRCGSGPCNVYTLAVANADGSEPRTVSYHETQEWDPAVLADGRVIYTRWDYVDRNAVHYQQLWTVRPDGSGPAMYYGNNTFSPVGVWEAREVPGSDRVMATAAAHHAMTAGSIILLDVTRGVDGLDPITRLTPDAAFPESETYVPPQNWHAPGSSKEYVTPEEQKRWPGHCYRCPYPLSETYFLAAYSFDSLVGEPIGNKANMFGIYLVDAFGNKELLYRDLSIASQWPVPIRPRVRPPVLAPMSDPVAAKEGTFFLQNVRTTDRPLPDVPITRLRIVQVLPKTTPNANNPTVGLANASPGKQVLGTVPVEPDGSAYFTAPSGIPIAFQALDERGQAVQTMRSITYLQPGERMSCTGCHENRLSAAPAHPAPQALGRPPSAIAPGPDGSNPLSYPLLVQPVLDKHCIRCHSGDTPAGPEGHPIVLTGEPEERYSKSYNVLARRVPYSSWGGLEDNGEPATLPDRFGARASSLMKMLLAGHHDVKLDADDLDRLVTWMDANALFYGTFDYDDQARQLRGERIQGPALQ